jgi:hypothetical protein
MQTLEDQLKAAASSAPAAISAAPAAPVTTAAPSTTVLTASAAGSAPAARPAIGASPDPQAVPDSPLQFHLGSAFFTPVGFMDFTTVIRQHTGGSGIGTNFASIPYGPSSFDNHLSDVSAFHCRIHTEADA